MTKQVRDWNKDMVLGHTARYENSPIYLNPVLDALFYWLQQYKELEWNNENLLSRVHEAESTSATEKERADIAELDRDRNYMWYRRANEKLQAAEAREKKLREAIEETINEALTLDDATAFLNSVLVSLYPKEEEAK